jgi:hypothetical protein
MNKEYYWLNEDSIKFLKRGYLLENEDPYQRYRDICLAAERYLGIEGFADKFESYLSKGYYSLSLVEKEDYRLVVLVVMCQILWKVFWKKYQK